MSLNFPVFLILAKSKPFPNSHVAGHKREAAEGRCTAARGSQKPSAGAESPAPHPPPCQDQGLTFCDEIYF